MKSYPKLKILQRTSDREPQITTAPQQQINVSLLKVCPLSAGSVCSKAENVPHEIEKVLTNHSVEKSHIVREFLTYLSLSALFILLGLLIGVLGYHWTAKMNWVDATVEASMILSGMGPVTSLPTTSSKIFASLYALFSGLIFVLAMGVVLSPLLYGLLKQVQVNPKKNDL
ncbi:two pore domain potassium channel family protein [Aphanothece sacrum]|uniref:Ion channel protein n=1 Tax=Aphanothece sacrum FPU1 TaxID=1920663 RepID=A0A401IBM7_APHSA|nr:two pore domain potassium channel family protein [Aphanothece sacrum]GBF78665.1 ion channel protein [Aphanothece sacrum FPU1]GBF84954.1 ion channel protein [Aphanothece sacrum FPU3]